MYEALPLSLTGQKAEKIITELCRFDTQFSDYQPACAERCGHCNKCQIRRIVIAWKLTALDACVFEVWHDDELVGIIYLTDIVYRQDAQAHFAFWDGDLRGKTGVLLKAIDRYAFTILELHRVTIEVPTHMHALKRYLVRKLGFQEEGEKMEALRYEGKWENVSILGKVNGRR